MKSFAVVLLCVFSLNVFSQVQRTPRISRDIISTQELKGLKVQVLKLANKVNTLTSRNITTLNRRDVMALKIVLQQAKAILKDTDIILDPVPRNVSCAQDYDVNLYHRTHASIRALADYELSYFSSDAINFANNWTQKYPCDYASEYEDKIATLKDFADKKLSYFSSDARKFALTNVDKLCLDQDYNALFDIHYRFADRQLSYFSSDARNYAWNQIRTMMLSCDVIY